MSAKFFWLQVFCIVLAGTAVWSNYQIVEETRVASVLLRNVSRGIDTQKADYKDAQVSYAALSQPARIQKLAESLLNMHDGAMVQVASFRGLPRRSADEQQVRAISAQMNSGNAAAGVFVGRKGE